MSNNLFGIHASALQLRGQRAEVLANNMANANTPGYKAKDIDFKDVLSNVSPGPVGLMKTNHAHLGLNGQQGMGGVGGNQIERTSQQPTLDGNTVDANKEQVEFTRNALQYQASLNFLDTRIRNIVTALKGE